MSTEAEELHEQALDLAARGEPAAARALLEEAAQLAPDDVATLYNLGVVRRQAGDPQAAVEAWRKAVALDPAHRDALFNLGNLLLILGDSAGSLAAYKQLLEGHPDFVAGWVNFGQLARRLGNLQVALEAFANALQLDDNDLSAHAAAAAALDEAGQTDAARLHWDAAYARAPEERDLLYNRAGFLHRHDELAAAAKAYRRLLNLHPDFASGWINQGMLQKRMGALHEAEASYRRALTIDPDDSLAHFNLSNLLLAQGKWKDGSAEYEWRRRLPGAYQGPALPALTSNEPPGTRVILWSDQGFGDTIQFLRYARVLAARGLICLVMVARPLLRLAASAVGVDAVFAVGERAPQAECQVALSSLPFQLSSEALDHGWAGPYLSATPNPAATGLIGLAWAGDPRHPNDHERSTRLDQLAPLLDAPGLRFASLLPPGPRRDELLASRWAGKVTDLGGGFTDFADAASTIAALPLTISVDTAAAHLAGALGQPGLVLLPAVECDWRWGTSGEATPWYPSLQLVRQERPGDWNAVAQRLASALTGG